MPPPHRRTYLTRWDPWLVRGLAVASAITATAAPAAPTGSRVVDLVYLAALGLGVPLLAARGRRRSWLWASVVLAPVARGWSLALVAVAIGVAVTASTRRVRERLLGAAVGATLINAALRLGPAHPTGLSLAVGTLGIGLLVGSGYRRHPSRERRLLVRGAVAVALCGVAAGVLLGLAGALARASLTSGSTAARQALDAARRGDPDQARERLAAAEAAFRDAQRTLDAAWAVPARALPLGAQQLHAIRVTVEQARHVAGEADAVAEAADYQKLRYRGRIDLAQVERLDRPTVRTSAALRSARDAIGDLRNPWLVPPLTDQLTRLQRNLSEALDESEAARRVLSVAPALLGGGGERHYFVAFTTPAELRGAGGFIGSYGELRAVDGKLSLVRSGPIRDLITAAPPGSRTLRGPKDYVRRYGRFRPQDFFQDLTYSPDFPQDASAISQLYPQSGGRPVDGVLAVDPYGLAALLRLTGPVAVPGLDEPLTADNAPELLLRTQYLELGEDDQTDLLDAAARATFERLTSGELPAPRALADALSPAVRGRHIQLWSPDQAEEAYFRSVGADGALPRPRGEDALVVAQQNTGNSKIDAYLHRTIAYRATIDPRTGRARGSVEITLRNDAPATGLPRAVIGNNRGRPPGSSISILSIYTPLALARADLDGFPVELGADREGGLRVYETAPLVIGPGRSVRLRLWLEGGLDLRDGYALLLAPQPLVNPDRVSVDVRPTAGWRIAGRDGADDRLLWRGSLRTPERIAGHLGR